MRLQRPAIRMVRLAIPSIYGELAMRSSQREGDY
jgi:hypothetical protein